MHRREWLALVGTGCLGVAPRVNPRPVLAQVEGAVRPRIALTIDDPNVEMGPHTTWPEVNRRLRATLRERQLQAALFVCGMRVDTDQGRRLLAEWDADGHILGSHSYSHLMYLARTSYETFAADFLRNEPVLAPFSPHRRWFRYPFLKEGDTADKRDRFRALLVEHGYRVGAVTVDASDWYVDDRLRQRLTDRPDTDARPYRDFYLAHLLDRAAFYRQLTLDVLGHDVTHTLLVHDTLPNSLFLPDVLDAFEQKGWRWVGAETAFEDPVFDRAPRTLPAGESLIWALASERGGFEDRLRWPGEDGEYERPAMEALGL